MINDQGCIAQLIKSLATLVKVFFIFAQEIGQSLSHKCCNFDKARQSLLKQRQTNTIKVLKSWVVSLIAKVICFIMKSTSLCMGQVLAEGRVHSGSLSLLISDKSHIIFDI